MTITVDSSGFTAMTRELSRISGKTHRDVIRSETGRVLETAMKFTGTARKDAFPRASLTEKEGNKKAHINSGKRGPAGREWLSEFSLKRGYTHYIMSAPYGKRPINPPDAFGNVRDSGTGPMRWSNALWARAQGMLTKLRAEKARMEAGGKRRTAKRVVLAGRGLAKQSWLHIAQSLGIPLRSVPPGVASAIPQDGKVRQSGDGREALADKAFYVEIRNFYPFLLKGRSAKSGTGKFDGNGILGRAIKSRVTAFGIALRVGVFKDLKGRASKYPGLFSVS